MVTKARNKGEASERILMRRLPDNEAVKKLINEVAPKFVGRNGGYTRVLKLGERVKDAAPMAILQWVEVMDKTVVSTKRVKKDNTKAKVMDAEIVAPKEEKKAKKTRTK
jgi:large subunit ribosomal protein L17